MQKLVRQFVRQSRKLFRRRLPGKQHDSSAIRCATSGCDLFRIFDQNIPGGSEVAEPLVVVARIAHDDADVRKFLAVGLTDIEHIGGTKSRDVRCVILVVLIFIFGLATNHRGENQYAFLSLLDAPAQLIPGTETCYVTGMRFLQSDQQHVVQTVAMEASDGFEIAGKRLALSGFQRSNKLLRRPLRDFFDLFRFHLRSPVRGFGSLTSSRGTKEPRLQENGRNKSESRSRRQPA